MKLLERVRGRKPAIIQRDRKDARVQTLGSTVLTRQKIEVGHECDAVVIKLGTQIVRMHYTDALQLQDMIRMHARQCKHLSGDKTKYHGGFAVLRDAEENYRRGF